MQGLIQLTGGVTTLPDLALGIVSGSFGSGDAGDITVEAGSLTLRDGGLIAPATLGSGNAGRAIVRVTGDALLDGGLISTATIGQQEDAGQSGPLFFEAENLTIRAGGSLATTTLGPGNAGQLHLNVRDRLLLSDRSDPNLPSGGNLSTGTLRVTDATSGNGGDIFVRAGTVLLDDGARISSSSEALGNAGSITVETARLLLSDDASIAATSLSGRGGNISLYSDDLAVLRNGSQITTRAGLAETGGGDGGNLSIRTDLFAAIEASQLSANAFSGTGGNISIAARSLFLGPRSPIDASSQLGIDGSVELSSETIDVDFDIEDLPSDLLENAVLESGCAGGSRNRFTFAGRGHRFGVFSHAVETSPTWHDDRDWRTIGTAGDPLQDSPLTPTISRPVRPVFETPSQTLEASRWESEPNGSVRLISSETSQRARPHLPGCADVNAG